MLDYHQQQFASGGFETSAHVSEPTHFPYMFHFPDDAPVDYRVGGGRQVWGHCMGIGLAGG